MEKLELTTKDNKSAKEWEKAVRINQDSYGRACMEITSKLGANLDKGLSPAEAEDIAVKGSGITGFMMGMIAQMIWSWHPRGEEFKKYFNGEFGTDPEANGIVNPAIMTIKETPNGE